MRLPAVLAACLLAAACGRGENESGPGGVTVGEARALDEAAEMLERRRLPEADLRGGSAQVRSGGENKRDEAELGAGR